MWINYRVLARLLTALLTLATATSNPGPQQRIHQEIRQIYTFQPHLLGPQELQQKSAILDQFWAKVKSNRADYIPALRQEVADLSNPPFFLYDGSMLLLAVSDTPSDRKVALAAIAHCDLSDVQTKDYFYQVHRLATLNEDTTAAAFHVLEDPGYRVFVPQHVLTLGQNYVVIYLLLPTDQSYWQQPAIDRLKTEHDETAQKTCSFSFGTPKPRRQTRLSKHSPMKSASRSRLGSMRKNCRIARIKLGQGQVWRHQFQAKRHFVGSGANGSNQ